MLSIHEIYNSSGYDFKRILDSLFLLSSPFNFTFEYSQYELYAKVLRLFLIETVQPKNRIFAFTQRLILCRCTRYVPIIETLIKNLEVKYNLDLNDHDYKNRTVNNLDVEDVDKVIAKPLYEYYLFKQLQ